jgi:hypothetical protein
MSPAAPATSLATQAARNRALPQAMTARPSFLTERATFLVDRSDLPGLRSAISNLAAAG